MASVALVTLGLVVAVTNHAVRARGLYGAAVPRPGASSPDLSPTPSTSTTASPSASPKRSGAAPPPPAPVPPGTVPPVGAYVRPGSVGYLGPVSALTVYPHGGAKPAGTTWETYGLQIDGDLTLDHVWVKGSIYWKGSGTLTITNSIIDGRDAWYVVYSAGAAKRMVIKNSTLRWDTRAAGAFPAGYDVAPIWQRGDPVMDIEHNDISGLPQGLNPTAHSIVDGNWIHGLVQNGGSNGPMHMDGIFSQGGSNILIQRNYVEVPATADVTGAIFLQDLDQTDSGVRVWGNFIKGGPYFNLRNETSLNLDVRNNTFGDDHNARNTPPGTIGAWVNNVRVDGSSVPQP